MLVWVGKLDRSHPLLKTSWTLLLLGPIPLASTLLNGNVGMSLASPVLPDTSMLISPQLVHQPSLLPVILSHLPQTSGPRGLREDAEEKQGHVVNQPRSPHALGAKAEGTFQSNRAPLIQARPVEGEGCGAGTGGGHLRLFLTSGYPEHTHTHTRTRAHAHTAHSAANQVTSQNKENPLEDNLLPMFQSSRQFSDGSFL